MNSMNRMKLIMIMFLVFFAVTINTAHSGQFGAPEPVAKEGKFSLGVGYFYFSDKWTPQDTGWIEAKPVANQPYVQVSYGFMKNAEAYLRLGASDLKVSSAFPSGTGLSGFKSEFSDGFKPFATVGVKGVFNITSSLGVGPFAQAGLYSDSYSDSTSGAIFGFPATMEMKIKNPSHFDLGMAIQNKIRGITLYAGPFVHWSKADVEGKIIIPGVGTAADSTTYKEKNNFGGFAGARVPLGKKFNLEVEGQMRNEFSLGSSLTYLY
ncbi:MAG: hypothetical protein HYW71_01935 [Candidatus Niyogibacteria bacterium]|nr:hypothetical protein [Candidatus Niyogibacteria bacterium]